jgi:hypothetical protein
MMRLGDALGEWKPLPGSGGDPLATIRAAWAGLVGEEVARAAQPVAIQGDALVVITSSSAWSHQLSFLTAGVLQAVRALPGCASIARLRFRVGTIRVPGGRSAAARRPRARAAMAPVRSAPATAVEALASLRAAIERTRAAHVASGGTFCSGCAAAVDPGEALCRPCGQARERSRTEACERLLFDAPWLTPAEVIAMVPGLDEGAYDAIAPGCGAWPAPTCCSKRASTPIA